MGTEGPNGAAAASLPPPPELQDDDGDAVMTASAPGGEVCLLPPPGGPRAQHDTRPLLSQRHCGRAHGRPPEQRPPRPPPPPIPKVTRDARLLETRPELPGHQAPPASLAAPALQEQQPGPPETGAEAAPCPVAPVPTHSPQTRAGAGHEAESGPGNGGPRRNSDEHANPAPVPSHIPQLGQGGRRRESALVHSWPFAG